MANTVTLVRATKAGTFTAAGTAADTIDVGGTQYTLQAAVGTTANEVKIGADLTATRDNLVAAIMAGAGSGTVYGSNTVKNTDARAVASGTDSIAVSACVPGAIGNQVALAEASTAFSWAGAATALSGGTGDIETWVVTLIDMNQINSEVLQELKKLTYAAD